MSKCSDQQPCLGEDTQWEEDPRLCFNSGILAETQEDYLEYLLSTKITSPLHPEAALVIVILLFVLGSLLKNN